MREVCIIFRRQQETGFVMLAWRGKIHCEHQDVLGRGAVGLVCMLSDKAYPIGLCKMGYNTAELTSGEIDAMGLLVCK